MRYTTVDLRKYAHIPASRHAKLTCGVFLLLLFLLLVGFGPALLTFEIAANQYWANYQLSDGVRRVWEDGGRSITQAREKYATPYPGSLVDQYLKHVAATPTDAQRHSDGFYQDRLFNVALLEHLVTRLIQPGEKTLVVHLRLGDALLNTVDAVDSLWDAEISTSMLLPRSYYECIAPDIAKVAVTRIVFVASMMHVNSAQRWHGAYMERRKSQYKDVVDAWFASRVPSAEREWRNAHFSPDHDFAYMAMAKHYVPGGGGFAAAAATLVRRAGGRVYRCQEWDAG